jgi:hypothetical protein
MVIYLSNSGTGGWKDATSHLYGKGLQVRDGVSKLADMGINVKLSFHYDITLIEKEKQ